MLRSKKFFFLGVGGSGRSPWKSVSETAARARSIEAALHPVGHGVGSACGSPEQVWERRGGAPGAKNRSEADLRDSSGASKSTSESELRPPGTPLVQALILPPNLGPRHSATKQFSPNQQGRSHLPPLVRGGRYHTCNCVTFSPSLDLI